MFTKFNTNIHNWRHFLRNSACAKKSIARSCDYVITMVRWRDTDGAIEHNFSAKLLSHHRHRVIASSPSLCRTIPSSSSNHRVIARSPSTQTRWCDGTIVNCVAVTRFWYYELMSQGDLSNNGATEIESYPPHQLSVFLA